MFLYTYIVNCFPLKVNSLYSPILIQKHAPLLNIVAPLAFCQIFSSFPVKAAQLQMDSSKSIEVKRGTHFFLIRVSC